MDCKEIQPLLGAFIDGELDAANSFAVASHLESCEACQKEVEALEAVSRAVKSVPKFVAPAKLKRSRDASAIGRGLMLFSMPLAAGILIGGAICYPIFAHSSWKGGVADVLVEQHVRALQAEHGLDVVSTDQHTVKPWFLGKTAIAPTVLDLKDDGYPLLGGRLDVVDTRPVPVMVYGLRKHFISLYVLPLPDEPLKSGVLHGFAVESWVRRDLNYVAVSDVSPADLDAFRLDFVKSQ